MDIKRFLIYPFVIFLFLCSLLLAAGIEWESEIKTGFGNSGVTWEKVVPEASPAFVCGTSTVLDAESNSHNTVLVGTQCWMADNMNIGTMLDSGATEPTNNNIIEKWCYNNNPSLCETESGLYNWNEAMKYSAVEGAQGICPIG